jgi:hypothetical protein
MGIFANRAMAIRLNVLNVKVFFASIIDHIPASCGSIDRPVTKINYSFENLYLSFDVNLGLVRFYSFVNDY